MKTLIIIEDDFRVRDFLIAYFGILYLNKLLKWNEKPGNYAYDHEKSDQVRTWLHGRIELWELPTIEDVVNWYPNSFTMGSIIILDNDLQGQSSENLFHLFSEENKKLTLINTYKDLKFNTKAKEAGFKNFINSDASKEYREEIGKTILDMVEKEN